MDELTPRQKEILAKIIESHIATSLPVGSKMLAQLYPLHLSPASVRNEMGILEEQGYLTHPHTSAGRIPTDKGYQFYVDKMVQAEPVSSELLDLIVQELREGIEDLEGLMTRISLILSTIVQEAVLVIPPLLEELYLKELSLILLDPNRLLAFWCTKSGLIQNCLVRLETAVTQDEIEKISRFIREELVGVPLGELEEVLLQRIRNRRDSLKRLYENALAIVRESTPQWRIPKVFIEGSRFFLNQPEFQDLRKFKELMELLEDKVGLSHLLARRSLKGGVDVAIGQQELPKIIWDCALVSASYGWGKSAGKIAVLGPRRMPYGKIMGLVHHMTEEVNRILGPWGS